MGSDRKEKKSKRSTYCSSSSSASEEEGREKRHRRGEEQESKSRKKIDKRKKRKDQKSHKHSSDKGSLVLLKVGKYKIMGIHERSREKHRSKHHKGDRHSKHGFPELSNDDYFSKNNEFATWLKEEKQVFFSNLSSEYARELFSDFVKEWNNQKLGSQYYEGIASGPRTAHNWKIKQ